MSEQGEKMVAMAKKKQPGMSGQHKNKGFLLRLHDAMLKALDDFVTIQGTDRNTECRIAIREYLTKHGMWPPKTSKSP